MSKTTVGALQFFFCKSLYSLCQLLPIEAYKLIKDFRILTCQRGREFLISKNLGALLVFFVVNKTRLVLDRVTNHDVLPLATVVWVNTTDWSYDSWGRRSCLPNEALACVVARRTRKHRLSCCLVEEAHTGEASC